MKTIAFSILLAVLGATVANAARPIDAPNGTTGICKDGSYSYTPEKKGACRGHKGVKDWYDEETAASKPKTEQAPQSSSTAPPHQDPEPVTPSATSHTSASPTQTAAGGGVGKVWANSNTKVYHCFGDEFYGKTKQGDYMSEGDAKARGFHASHGKACT